MTCSERERDEKSYFKLSPLIFVDIPFFIILTCGIYLMFIMKIGVGLLKSYKMLMTMMMMMIMMMVSGV